MFYKIKLKGTIEVEADSEQQALDRAFEVLENLEDDSMNYDANVVLQYKPETITIKKEEE